MRKTHTSPTLFVRKKVRKAFIQTILNAACWEHNMTWSGHSWHLIYSQHLRPRVYRWWYQALDPPKNMADQLIYPHPTPNLPFGGRLISHNPKSLRQTRYRSNWPRWAPHLLLDFQDRKQRDVNGVNWNHHCATMHLLDLYPSPVMQHDVNMMQMCEKVKIIVSTASNWFWLGNYCTWTILKWKKKS